MGTLLLATMAVWAVMATALLIYTSGSREPRTHTLVIPEGTQELITRGQNPLEIPSTWSFLADDTIVLVNEDRVDHWLGGDLWVPALDTREYDLQPDFGGSSWCSLHPSGAIDIDVDVRDFDVRATMLPTLAFGPALGLVLAGTRRVVRLLDEPDRRADR
ncbi:MAG: hypothetical protein ACE5GB_10020 [Acidimicrobiales bacterium]